MRSLTTTPAALAMPTTAFSAGLQHLLFFRCGCVLLRCGSAVTVTAFQDFRSGGLKLACTRASSATPYSVVR